MRLSIAASAALATVLSSTATAQEPVLFTLEQAQSQWAWSGTTTLGPIEGNPSQSFALSGTVGALITSGPQPIQTGRANGDGAAMVVPDLSGRIPNPIAILPPLAIVDVTGLSLRFDTPSGPSVVVAALGIFLLSQLPAVFGKTAATHNDGALS